MDHLFFAVPLDNLDLAGVLSSLKNDLPGTQIQWHDPDIYHLTLYYLPGHPVEQVGQFFAALQRFHPQSGDVVIGRISYFKSEDPAGKVIVAEPADGAECLRRIRGRLDYVLTEQNLQYTHPHPDYRPHITLGRYTGAMPDETVLQQLNARLHQVDAHRRRLAVERIALYRSDASGRSACYRILRTWQA